MKLYNELWFESEIEQKIAEDLAHEMGLFLPVAKYLVSQGIDRKKEAEEFLNPQLDSLDLLKPLKQTDLAANEIMKSIENNERILVYGDYDVDGITSTLILVKFLKKLKADVSWFIPNRHEDGYGIHMEKLKERYDTFELLVTVDCGITSVEESRELQDSGKKVIITDHHEPKEELPLGIVVDPKCHPEDYQDYAGVGVVFQLIKELERRSGIKSGLDAVIFTAVGTIADLMPLRGVNRTIVKLGLSQMDRLDNPGLTELIKVMGLESKQIKASDIAFKIAPAVNASGRLGSALDSLELFLTEQDDVMRHLAANLKITNDERKAIEKEIVEMAMKQVDPNDDFIVVRGDDWNDGVVGIVASRLVESYRKPTIVMTRKSDCYKGSGRSIGHFHLLKALDAVKNEIRQYGGHQFAAGMTVDLDRFEGFKLALNEYARIHLTEYDKAIRYSYFDHLSIDQINAQTVDELSNLEPFGLGNPKPLFVFKEAKVSHMKRIGISQDHLKMNVSIDNRMIDAVGFNQADKIELISRGSEIDLIGTIDKNIYLGVEYVNIYFKDFRHSDHRTIMAQYDYALYIQSLTSLVKNYHLNRAEREYLSPDYAIVKGIEDNCFEIDLERDFKGPVDFSKMKDLSHGRHREWFEKNLIKKLPQRSDLIKIYKKVERNGSISLKIFDESSREIYNCNMDILSGQVLSELGLMKQKFSGNILLMERISHDRANKLDLNHSQTFRNIARIKEDWNEFKRQNPCD